MLIKFDDFSVKLIRKRVKNINLRIQRSGNICISAPFKMPLALILDFLNSKRHWITMHRNRLQRLAQETPQCLIAGEYLYFLGERYKIEIHEKIALSQIILEAQTIHFFVPTLATFLEKKTLLMDWFYSKMKNYTPALVEKWEERIGVEANLVCIKPMTTRWGSCHPIKKHITLNLLLIKKPLICLEYVIVHELVHFLEASHNQRFYQLMDNFLPHW